MVTAGHGKRNVSVIMIHIIYLSVHIMKWFDAMCEEPFDAVAKVVVCVSEYDETNDLTQCVKKHFWSGKKPFFIRNECGAASVCVGKQSAAYQLPHYRCTVTNENVLPLHLRLCAVLSFRSTFPVVCCFHCEMRSGEPRTLIREHLYG